VTRLAVAVTACALLFASCGDDDSTPSERTVSVPEAKCPEGTPEYGVRDVLPKAPSGTALLQVAKRERDQARAGFEAGFGDRIRSLRFAVVAPKGRNLGTGVGVLNLKIAVSDDEPPETGGIREPLTIAGKPGLIAVAPGDTGARAAGPVGDCAMVVIRGPDEASVRNVADAIQQPD
jgi:hypothetical protein